MTEPLLVWRNATYHDKGALQSFKCSRERPKKRVTAVGASYRHPKQYEWEVQELVQATKPRDRGSRTTRVGLDAEGLGAVSVFDELDPGELYELSYMALACRLRGGDGRHADEMMRDTLQRIEDRCAELGSREAAVVGQIDPDNGPSKLLCGRHGLRYATMDEPFEVWRKIVVTPDPPD